MITKRSSARAPFGSEIVIESGSSKTVVASAIPAPCLRQFAESFLPSHSKAIPYIFDPSSRCGCFGPVPLPPLLLRLKPASVNTTQTSRDREHTTAACWLVHVAPLRAPVLVSSVQILESEV